MANSLTANDFQIVAKVVPNTDDLKKQLTKVSETAFRNINVKVDGKSFKNVNKLVQTYTDEVGRAYKTVTVFNDKEILLEETLTQTSKKFKDAGNQTKSTKENLDKATNSTKQATKEVKNLGNASKDASTKAKSLGQSFADIVLKVGKFYLATKPIQMMQQAFDEAIDTVKEFDDTLVEFRKVSDLSGESLTAYTKKLAKLGETTGNTMTSMVEAATEFKKSGYSDDDAATLANVASLYRNIADEEISAGDSANFLIAQMKAFNISTSDSLHIIDSVNEVSNSYAVSSADLANNLGKISSVLAVSGTTMEESLGLLTAITEVTRSASKASRGLKI